jgi:putative transposase
VLRLMREARLARALAAEAHPRPPKHDGVITTERPDEMWGTDLTSVMTLDEGQATVFIAVDHRSTSALHAKSQPGIGPISGAGQ